MCEHTMDSRGSGWYCCRDNSYNGGHRGTCWVCDRERHEESLVPRKPGEETAAEANCAGRMVGRRLNRRTRSATSNIGDK